MAIPASPVFRAGWECERTLVTLLASLALFATVTISRYRRGLCHDIAIKKKSTIRALELTRLMQAYIFTSSDRQRNTNGTSQPASFHCLHYHIPACSLCSFKTSLLLVSESAKHLLPTVSVSLPSVWHSIQSSSLVHHHRHSVVFLKPTVSSRPSVPRSCSHKCLRFGLLCTVKDFTYFIHLYISRHVV